MLQAALSVLSICTSIFESGVFPEFRATVFERIVTTERVESANLNIVVRFELFGIIIILNYAFSNAYVAVNAFHINEYDCATDAALFRKLNELSYHFNAYLQTWAFNVSV